MAKKNMFPTPVVRTIDEIANLTDEALYELREIGQNYLEKAHQKGVGGFHALKPWEEEICYLDREIQIRQTRTACHEDWKKLVASGLAFDNVEDLYKHLDEE